MIGHGQRTQHIVQYKLHTSYTLNSNLKTLYRTRVYNARLNTNSTQSKHSQSCQGTKDGSRFMIVCYFSLNQHPTAYIECNEPQGTGAKAMYSVYV